MMKSEKAKKAINFQLVVMVISIIFIILSFFIKSLVDYREIVLGIILLTMAYTNNIVYEKKKMTIIYIIFGLLLIIPSIIRLVG